MIDTLIFDFDGLILETESPVFQAWQEAFRDHGANLDRALWQRYVGVGHGEDAISDALEALTGSKVDREALRMRTRERSVQLIAGSPVLPGVEQYLDDAPSLGVKLGVASSSGRDWVEGHLTERGLLGRFEVVKCKEDVPRVKPDPTIYLDAVEALLSSREKAVAFEDSFNGVMAAKRAGLYCVAVPNAMTRDMPLDAADMRLDSLADLPLEDLLAQIAESKRGA